jgi:hypothetical protein
LTSPLQLAAGSPGKAHHLGDVGSVGGPLYQEGPGEGGQQDPEQGGPEKDAWKL